jgi:hypothetical protein
MIFLGTGVTLTEMLQVLEILKCPVQQDMVIQMTMYVSMCSNPRNPSFTIFMIFLKIVQSTLW